MIRLLIDYKVTHRYFVDSAYRCCFLVCEVFYNVRVSLFSKLSIEHIELGFNTRSWKKLDCTLLLRPKISWRTETQCKIIGIPCMLSQQLRNLDPLVMCLIKWMRIELFFPFKQELLSNTRLFTDFVGGTGTPAPFNFLLQTNLVTKVSFVGQNNIII